MYNNSSSASIFERDMRTLIEDCVENYALGYKYVDKVYTSLDSKWARTLISYALSISLYVLAELHKKQTLDWYSLELIIAALFSVAEELEYFENEKQQFQFLATSVDVVKDRFPEVTDLYTLLPYRHLARVRALVSSSPLLQSIHDDRRLLQAERLNNNNQAIPLLQPPQQDCYQVKSLANPADAFQVTIKKP
jgi:hypothetical protein